MAEKSSGQACLECATRQLIQTSGYLRRIQNTIDNDPDWAKNPEVRENGNLILESLAMAEDKLVTAPDTDPTEAKMVERLQTQVKENKARIEKLNLHIDNTGYKPPLGEDPSQTIEDLSAHIYNLKRTIGDKWAEIQTTTPTKQSSQTPPPRRKQDEEEGDMEEEEKGEEEEEEPQDQEGESDGKEEDEEEMDPTIKGQRGSYRPQNYIPLWEQDEPEERKPLLQRGGILNRERGVDIDDVEDPGPLFGGGGKGRERPRFLGRFFDRGEDEEVDEEDED